MLDTLSEDSSPSSQFPRAQVCPTKNSLRQVPRVCQSLVGAPILSGLTAQWFNGAIVHGQFCLNTHALSESPLPAVYRTPVHCLLFAWSSGRLEVESRKTAVGADIGMPEGEL